jgi:hypothetical protein
MTLGAFKCVSASTEQVHCLGAFRRVTAATSENAREAIDE